MNTEELGTSRILNLIFKPAGKMMESRLRKWLMNPVRTLKGAGIQPGQTVLEVGCGTGFFTIPAAALLGDQGCLVAMDPLLDYTRCVSEKVKAAGLKNVRSANKMAYTITGDANRAALKIPFLESKLVEPGKY